MSSAATTSSVVCVKNSPTTARPSATPAAVRRRVVVASRTLPTAESTTAGSSAMPTTSGAPPQNSAVTGSCGRIGASTATAIAARRASGKVRRASTYMPSPKPKAESVIHVALSATATGIPVAAIIAAMRCSANG